MATSTILTVTFWLTGLMVAAYLPAILGLYWLVKVRGGEENEARLLREREISGLFGERSLGRWQGAGPLWAVVFSVLVTAFGFFLAYPAAVALIRTEASAPLTPLESMSATLFFAFLGAYLFAVHTTARRFHTGDLSADTFIQVTTRLIVALIAAAVFALILPQISSAGGRADLSVLGYVAAFVIGIFPENGLSWILSSFNRLFTTVTRLREADRLDQDSSYDLTALRGLNYWHAVRLNVEGIDNVHNLANADLPQLIRRTRFSVQQVVDWVDQAVLLIHLSNLEEFERLQGLGIHGLSDFQAVYRNDSVSGALEAALAGEAGDGQQRVELLYATLQQAPSGDALRLFWRYKSSYLTGAFESYSRGQLFADLQRYEEAIEQFNLALEQNPLRPEIMVSRGRVCRLLAQQRELEGSPEAAEDQRQQALSDFSRAEALDPFYVPAYLERGAAYLQMEKVDQAEADFAQAVRLSRKNPQALVGHALALQQQAQALQQQGQEAEARLKYEAAIADCEEANQRDPGFLKGRVQLAAIYRALGRYDEARRLLDEAIQIDPRAPELYLERAQLSVVGERRRYAAAHGDFERALRLHAANPAELYTRWGGVYLEEGDFVRAIAVLRLALAENPTYLPAYRRRASAYQSAGRLAQAIADYTHIVQALDPDAADVYVNRATCYTRLGKHEQALRDYDRGLQLNPNLPLAYSNRGQLYREMGRESRALADFEEAVRVQERLLEAGDGSFQPSALPYNNLGTALMQIKDWEGAHEQFVRATSLEPRYGEALNNLGLAEEALGRPGLALNHFDSAIRLEPDNPAYYYNRGRVYLQQGEPERAMSDLDQAIALDPDYAIAYAQRADAQQRAGRPQAAEKDARRALALDPRQELARLVLARLQEEAAVTP